MGKITVKPIEKVDWRGNPVDKAIPRPVVYEILPGKDGQYATGLDDSELKYDDPTNPDSKRKLTERGYYEALLGENMPNFFIPSKHKDTYWAKKASRLTLDYVTQTFDTSNPRDYVRWKNMKASRFVANSLEDYNKGFYPDATHYIHNEEEEMEEKAKRTEVRNQAYKEIFKMTKARKLDLVLVLMQKDMSEQTDDFLTVAVSELAEKKSQEVLEFSQRDKEDSGLHAKIISLNLKNHIIQKEGKYMFGDIFLGITIPQVIEFLKNERNQEIKIALFEKA